MAGVEKRDFDSPDETRTPEKTRVDVVSMGGVVQSGTMRVTHEDGTVLELGPGDAYVIEPGHDAEVISQERFVGFEFEQKSAEEYARQ